jgi:hypothetical protein
VTEVLERLHDAQNRHDLDAFVACFDPEYRSEQPVHPDRAFVGREQVRKNWAEVFAGVPDFQAERSARRTVATPAGPSGTGRAPAPMGHASTCAGSPSSGSARTASSGAGSTWRTSTVARRSTRPCST